MNRAVPTLETVEQLVEQAVREATRGHKRQYVIQVNRASEYDDAVAGDSWRATEKRIDSEQPKDADGRTLWGYSHKNDDDKARYDAWQVEVEAHRALRPQMHSVDHWTLTEKSRYSSVSFNLSLEVGLLLNKVMTRSAMTLGGAIKRLEKNTDGLTDATAIIKRRVADARRVAEAKQAIDDKNTARRHAYDTLRDAVGALRGLTDNEMWTLNSLIERIDLDLSVMPTEELGVEMMKACGAVAMTETLNAFCAAMCDVSRGVALDGFAKVLGIMGAVVGRMNEVNAVLT